MRLTRIHCGAGSGSEQLAPGQTLQLDSRNSHYLLNVLRVKAGHPLILFDGGGVDYSASVSEVSRKQLTVVVDTALPSDQTTPESPLHTTLAIGISKGERMDFVVQKSVELGVSAIQPLLTSRTSVRQKAEQLQKKHAHWQGVAISACEQSGRSVVPELYSPVNLADWLDSYAASLSDGSVNMVLQAGTESFASLAKGVTHSVEKVALLVGPEGGLDDEELALANNRGFVGVGFGQRVLRTETAPLVGLSLVQQEWGDF